jgi:hypothetical protein
LGTTRRSPRFGYNETIASVMASLGALGTDYVDLVLLHFPQCFPGVCSEEESARSMRAGGWRAAWAALQELQKQGAILACGVSNFDLVNDLDTVRPRPLVRNLRCFWFEPSVLLLLNRPAILTFSLFAVASYARLQRPIVSACPRSPSPICCSAGSGCYFEPP